MKKVGMLLMGLALTFASCEKEVENPDGSNNSEDCTCGVIVQEDDYTTTSGGGYSEDGSPGLISINNKYKVKNDCSGNVSGWIYSDDQFNPGQVGYDYCHHSEW